MIFQEQYRKKKTSLEQCLSLIRSHDIIATAGAACEPPVFVAGLETIIDRVEDVTLVKGRDYRYPFLYDPKIRGHLFTVGHLFAEDLRRGQAAGLAAYIPSDLSNFSRIRTQRVPNNVFAAQVTDMDERGNFQIPYCQMFEADMLACAKTVILEVNPQFRRVRGGLEIPIDRVTRFFLSDKPPLTIPREEPTALDQKIGAYIADLIHDGDTIQLGIGRLPDAVAVKLTEKNDLGLHTEMFTSNMVDLVRRGVITGRRKTVDPGEHVGGFALGDMALYETLSDDPACRVAPCSYTNDPYVISRQDNMKSVNTCIEIDLLGQICSDTIGPRQYSGAGGAADFARGAMCSRGGRGIIAFASTTKNGAVSKIKPMLTPGAAVTIPRNCADTIITEYGVAELKGLTVPERAMQLIAVAHPDFRKALQSSAKEMGIL